MDYTCVTAIVVLGGGFLGLTAMFLNYKAKFDRKSITLEKNDQQHEHKHHLNEQKIKVLEEKNVYAHVKNMPDKRDSRDIAVLCSYCSYARAKKENFYCPRFSSGRDV